MNKLTYYRLSKIATGLPGRSAPSSPSTPSTPASAPENIPGTVLHDPRDLYLWGFTNPGSSPSSAASHWDRVQAARRAAAERSGASNIPADVTVPVIAYPRGNQGTASRIPFHFFFDSADQTPMTWNHVRNNAYGVPAREWVGKPGPFGSGVYYPTSTRPSVGPLAVNPAQVYPSTQAADLDYFRSRLAELPDTPENRSKRAEMQSLIAGAERNPHATRIHEVYGHGATPIFYDGGDNPMDSLTGDGVSVQLNNPRGSYGLKTAEGLGGMHFIKGFWYRKHPNEPLSDNWDEALEQFRSKGYIGEDGLFNDSLFDGTGYDVDYSTINSIMELLHRQNELFTPEQQQQFHRQLQWYWPQANNNRYRRYSNYA